MSEFNNKSKLQIVIENAVTKYLKELPIESKLKFSIRLFILLKLNESFNDPEFKKIFNSRVELSNKISLQFYHLLQTIDDVNKETLAYPNQNAAHLTIDKKPLKEILSILTEVKVENYLNRYVDSPNIHIPLVYKICRKGRKKPYLISKETLSRKNMTESLDAYLFIVYEAIKVAFKTADLSKPQIRLICIFEYIQKSYKLNNFPKTLKGWEAYLDKNKGAVLDENEPKVTDEITLGIAKGFGWKS